MIFKARLADITFRASLALKRFAIKREHISEDTYDLSVRARTELRRGEIRKGLSWIKEICYTNAGTIERKRVERALDVVVLNDKDGQFVVDAMLALANVNANLRARITEAIRSNDKEVINQHGKTALAFLVSKILDDGFDNVNLEKLLVECALSFPMSYLSALAATNPNDRKLEILKRAATSAYEKLFEHLIRVEEILAYADPRYRS